MSGMNSKWKLAFLALLGKDPEGVGFGKRFAVLTAFRQSARLNLYRRMAKYMQANIDPQQLFARIRARLKSRKDDAWKAYDYLLTDLIQKKSMPIDEVLGRIAAPDEALLIKAGYESGNLARALNDVVEMMEAKGRMRKMLIKELFMLGAVVAAFVAMIVISSTSVFPEIEKSIPQQYWSGAGIAYKRFNDWLLRWWLPLNALTGLGVVGVIASLPRWRKGVVRDFLDKHVPPWSIYREIQSASLMMGVSMMSRAGKPVDEVLKTYRSLATPWMMSHLAIMDGAIVRSEKPGVVLTCSDLFNRGVSDMIQDFDAAGVLPAELPRMGREIMEQTEEYAKARLSGATIMIAFITAGIALWMMAAIYGAAMGAQQEALKSI